MTDELNKLQEAFRRELPVKADPKARDAALQAAMSRFEDHNLEKISTNRQGSDEPMRLKDKAANTAVGFLRRFFMTGSFPKMSHMLAGGVSLAAIALVINVNGIDFSPANWSDVRSVPGEDRTASEIREQSGNETKTVVASKPKMDPTTPGASHAEPEADQVLADVVETRELAAEVPVTAIAQSRRSRNMQASGPIGDAPVSAVAPPSAFSAPAPTDVVANTPHYEEQGRDKFSNVPDNPVKRVADDPVSTFSADVDTASYAFVRKALNNGTLPPKDAVRIEELINYFDYDYPVPDSRDAPFRPDVEIMPTPWNADTQLMRIGVKGYDIERAMAPKANLVFLIDTSGSMESPDKLPLLRQAFRMLVSNLQPDDVVSIVAYAGSAGTVLAPTKVSESGKIFSALDNLAAGGSTAGGEGIRQAYQLAEQNLDTDGINRIILATDGDFNVGINQPEQLKDFVERKRETGVTLSVLGFGRGNYNDILMQELAQNGNGNASYIDTLSEARKVLVDEANSTLFPIAKDVKFQVEFNPMQVSEYRLIGYETRQLKREDFNNDKVDAGDIGAGHTVTALYEFRPASASGSLIEPLRYQANPKNGNPASSEIAFLKVRYKLPDADQSKLIEMVVGSDLVRSDISNASENTRFATAVAGFGEVLKGGQYTGSYSFDDVQALGAGARGADSFNYRGAFLELVRLAQSAQAMEPLKQ